MTGDPIADKVAELMAAAPGKVRVRRLHELQSVRLLRTARELLSAPEAEWIERRLATLRTELIGIETAVEPTEPTVKTSRLRALISPTAALGSRGARVRREWDEMVTSAGGPAKLPAPPELIAAAEAWLVAAYVWERTPEQLDVLIAPWQEATVVAAV